MNKYIYIYGTVAQYDQNFRLCEFCAWQPGVTMVTSLEKIESVWGEINFADLSLILPKKTPWCLICYINSLCKLYVWTYL